MNRTSSKPMPLTRSTSSGGAGESIEKAMSALPPSVVRETAMFAMLTPASPNIVPTFPITPGHVVVREERHARSELDVDREAERARQEEPVLGPHRRPDDLELLRRPASTITRTRFV